MEPAPGSSDLGPLSQAADACLVFDLDGRLVAANEAACRAVERTFGELRGQPAWEVCTCLSEAGFARIVAAVSAEGPQNLLGHLRRRDRSLLATDTHLWLAPLGGVPHVFAVAREMRGYQHVMEERDLLAGLVEESAELVLLFDAELRVTHVNAAGLARLGFERLEDALGLALDELCVFDQRALVQETIAPQLAREHWDGELVLRSWRDPALTTPCWVHAFAVRDSRSKKRMGFALVARDMSARLATEQRRARLLRLAELARTVATELLESDDLNRAVFAILAGVTEVLGAARGYLSRLREDGRWLLRTHVWSRESGAVHEKDGPLDSGENYRWATDVLGRGEVLRIDDAVPLPAPADQRGLLDPGERALLALPVLVHARLESVFAFVCERGHVWEEEEVAAVRLLIESFARGVERQVAEREKTQALRELEEAVEREKVANRYKSEFLASMSHELRTPMNAIRGYAELLSRPHPERAVQEIWVQNLRRSTEYLLGLIHDVLDLSKIEAGHMRLEREPAALAEILRSVEDLLAAGAREKCLGFQVTVEGEVPEFFETDPVRLKQILVNLTGNAIKFTTQGSVSVRARRKENPHGRPTLEFAVRDTGIGIPAEAIDKLFRPFSQVHQRSGGTGLGLQISRSLARLLGGDIGVQSTMGHGSTFTLELPLDGARGVLRSLPAHGTAQPARALPSALRGKRILVVDDSLENREVLRFLLQEAGASCDTAMNGQAGIERALAAEKARTPYDAILMDMNMPVMDGFAATRALIQAGTSSPIVALTALALSGDEERCREAGCVAYVGKPIVPSAFFETLARHVRASEKPPPLERPRRAEPARAPAAENGNVLSLAQHPRFRGLVERYMASFPELVDRLRQLERRGEFEELRTLVHRLRGTAASYGFPAVSQAAGRCEDAIRSGAPRQEVARGLEELLGRLTLAAAG